MVSVSACEAEADNIAGLPEKKCIASGCNSERCVEEGSEESNAASICMWKKKYSCLKLTNCEVQSDGNCGWTETSEYLKCLEEAKAPNQQQ